MAIMGPSGSGKSTLLDALAGKVTALASMLWLKIVYDQPFSYKCSRCWSLLVISHPQLARCLPMIDAAGRLAPNTVLTGEMLLNGEKKATLSYGTAVCHSLTCP